MPKKKLTYRKLLELANEEKKTAKLYKEWGLWRFSRDEKRHSNVFRSMARKISEKRRGK